MSRLLLFASLMAREDYHGSQPLAPDMRRHRLVLEILALLSWALVAAPLAGQIPSIDSAQNQNSQSGVAA